MTTTTFTVCLTTGADATVRLELPNELLAKLLDGEPFDVKNKRHIDVLSDFFFGQNSDLPSLCAQCTGWGADYSLDLGDDWDVTEIFEKRDGDE